MKILRGTPPNPRVVGDKSPLKKKPRRTPPSGPGVRQLHQRRLTQSRVRGGPRQGPAPDRPLRLALTASAILTVGTIFGAAIFHVFLIQSEFRLDQVNKEATKEEARYEKLRLDVAQLSAPDRIVATAQQRLGMVVPPQVAYLMAPVPQDPGGKAAHDDPAAPSLAGGWAEVKPHLGTRP